MPQRHSTPSQREPPDTLDVREASDASVHSRKPTREPSAAHIKNAKNLSAVFYHARHLETSNTAHEHLADQAGRSKDDQVLPFDHTLRIALLVTIGLLTAVCWAFVLWGVGALIQLSVDGLPQTASPLISESMLWITALVWPIAFLGLAMVCISNDRQSAERDVAVMNNSRKRSNAWPCQE
ncbi:MAG: hypothetical protein ACR2O1_02030 [Boseongicola sp.]